MVPADFEDTLQHSGQTPGSAGEKDHQNEKLEMGRKACRSRIHCGSLRLEFSLQAAHRVRYLEQAKGPNLP